MLSSGAVVAVPTETVYGLAASIDHPSAIDAIYRIKGRPSTNPLIVHIASLAHLHRYAVDLPPGFDALAASFWPGPLTVILNVDPTAVPAAVRAHLPTAGFRIPSHPLALQLLMRVGPLVMPSANISGKPSATQPQHIADDFGTHLPMIDGNCCSAGVESTILIHILEKWHIIREGAIAKEAFTAVLGYEPPVYVKVNAHDKPLCPGQCFRHYAPQATLLLTEDLPPTAEGVILGFEDRSYPPGIRIISLGPTDDAKIVAANLYAQLRQLDHLHIKQAFVDMNFPRHGLWNTIRERLQRAASGL
jgi:L-threonylcarbamoyladenylate synthase